MLKKQYCLTTKHGCSPTAKNDTVFLIPALISHSGGAKNIRPDQQHDMPRWLYIDVRLMGYIFEVLICRIRLFSLVDRCLKVKCALAEGVSISTMHGVFLYIYSVCVVAIQVLVHYHVLLEYLKTHAALVEQMA